MIKFQPWSKIYIPMEYTLKHKKNQSILLILATFITVFFFTGSQVIAQESPGDIDQLKTQQEAKRLQLIQLQEQVADLQKQINQQHSKVASLTNEVALYDLQIKQTEQQIAALDTEIDVTNGDIIETIHDITNAESKITTKKTLLRDLLMEIYQYDQASPLELLLQHDNFSDLLNEIQNTVSYQDKNQELLVELQSLKNELNLKQKTLEEKKKGLQTLKVQAEATHDSLQQQEEARQNLLKYTRGQENRYKQLLTSVSEEEAQVSREVYELDLSIRQKLGDKSLPPIQGVLAWPMEGVLTQGFGNTGFTKLGYTFHNGIDVAAPANTPVHAAGDGIVYATGSGKAAYGNWVVLRHTIVMKDGTKTNIFTLYGHLNNISVGTGKAVLQGDVVGLEGNTGNTTRLLYGPERGYHLHFTIFDEEGFGIQDGAYTNIYGPYKVPYGYPYNPMDFLK